MLWISLNEGIRGEHFVPPKIVLLPDKPLESFDFEHRKADYFV